MTKKQEKAKTQENDFNLYDYCSLHKEKNVFDSMTTYFSYEANLNHKILNNPAKQLAKEFDLNLNDDVMRAFCHRLSVHLASNSMSQYVGKMDSHRHISKLNITDFVLFGDSITDWGPWYEFFPDKKIVNRGIAGDNTLGMLYRIKDILPLAPKRVFFLAGINDLAQGYLVDEIFNRYCQMLTFCQQNNVEPVVQSTLFVGKRLATLNPSVEQLNIKLERHCIDNNIHYINLNAVLCPNKILLSEFTQDDLHLTFLAYQKWAEILTSWL